MIKINKMQIMNKKRICKYKLYKNKENSFKNNSNLQLENSKNLNKIKIK